MTQAANTMPAVRPGGLVTVAYLKARLDEGDDHLGIFLPLVLDVIPGLTNRNFSTLEVQEALAASHGVAMPQEALATLLKRATRQGLLIRDAGRFAVKPGATLPRSSVAAQKRDVEAAQERLGAALLEHAHSRALTLASTDEALALLLRFLETEQVALLLGTGANGEDSASVSARECAVVSEFLHDVVARDSALRGVLAGVLEGLVLYHAAFLPDLSDVDRSFKDLRVVFDSMLVRQALGYEGEGAKLLALETVNLLKKSGVSCLVLDKSVQEIQRILSMYETKLATPAGRRSLRPVPMARHFMQQLYSPSDIQEMSALLEGEIKHAGFRIISAPARIAKYTSGESELAARLADPQTHDLTEPRVLHDVDCVAAVLTLREGHRSRRVEDARVVFATTATLVIKNTRLWWEEDERESGIPPVVHIRSLANLAWLKKPAVSADFQVRELVALCEAGMRPSQKTWQRFLDHLDKLQQSQRLTEDEVTAIIVSSMSDRFLREAELDDGDGDDLDAVTLDEVVTRVKAQYGAAAEEQMAALSADYERRMSEVLDSSTQSVAAAVSNAREAAERERRRILAAEKRAGRWSQSLCGIAYWLVSGLVIAGAIAVTVTFSYSKGWLGVLVGLSVVVLAVLELAGVLGHLRALRRQAEHALRARLKDWLLAEVQDDPSAI